jgi:RNA polymerase sigma-70 factor (ECF subfamily)
VPPPDQVLPWLYRVVRNEAITAQRSGARRRRREERAGTPEAWFGTTDDRLDADEVTRRLAELPLELREVIVARLWGGLTFEAVAALAGCSVPTAHRRYQAGLAQLRERLEGRWTRTPTAPTT